MIMVRACAPLAAALAIGLAALFGARTARAESALEVHTSIDDVRACALAGGGVVLAGTTGGVALYGADGKLARVATALDGLPDTRVHALLVEGDTAWIGTERGLAKAHLEGTSLSRVEVFASPPVRAIHRHAGALYVGTWGGGVMRARPGAGALERVPFASTPSAEASRVAALATFDGALVGATAGAGLVRLEGARVVPLERARVPRMIWSLAVHDGRLWVGSLQGVVSLAPAGAARFEIDADARALAETDGGLLVGTFGKGLLRAGAAPELASESFVQAVDARDGARCVGTRAGLLIGASRASRAASNGLADNDLTAVARDGERLWIGTYDQGVGILEAGRVRRVGQVDARVNAIAIEARGGSSRAWIATARGVTMIDGETARTYGGGGELPSSAVHAVTALAAGGVLVGTERGAAIIRDGTVTRIDDKQGLPVRAVWAVAEAPGGVFLLGTSAGLYAGPLGGPWQRASIASGHLDDDWVTALAVSGRDVFVGTYNAGVTRLTLDGGALVRGEHLGGGYVNPGGLAIAHGALYAATMDGLLARPLAGGAWRTLAGATTGRDVTGVVPAGADLWVASRRGLVRARP